MLLLFWQIRVPVWQGAVDVQSSGNWLVLYHHWLIVFWCCLVIASCHAPNTITKSWDPARRAAEQNASWGDWNCAKQCILRLLLQWNTNRNTSAKGQTHWLAWLYGHRKSLKRQQRCHQHFDPRHTCELINSKVQCDPFVRRWGRPH